MQLQRSGLRQSWGLWTEAGPDPTPAILSQAGRELSGPALNALLYASLRRCHPLIHFPINPFSCPSPRTCALASSIHTCRPPSAYTYLLTYLSIHAHMYLRFMYVRALCFSYLSTDVCVIVSIPLSAVPAQRESSTFHVVCVCRSSSSVCHARLPVAQYSGWGELGERSALGRTTVQPVDGEIRGTWERSIEQLLNTPTHSTAAQKQACYVPPCDCSQQPPCFSGRLHQATSHQQTESCFRISCPVCFQSAV